MSIIIIIVFTKGDGSNCDNLNVRLISAATLINIDRWYCLHLSVASFLHVVLPHARPAMDASTEWNKNCGA